MGGRVVEGTGLENQQACKRLVGSNPTPSANCHKTLTKKDPVETGSLVLRRLSAVRLCQRLMRAVPENPSLLRQ